MNPGLDETFGSKVPMRRPGGSREERRLGAKFVLRRVSWVFGPLVYWSGTAPRSELPASVLFQPVHERLARRMKGLAPGFYSIELRWPTIDSVPGAGISRTCRAINPVIQEVRPITDREVAEVARSLRGAGRHAEALESHVGDIDAWCVRAQESLLRVTAALASIRSLSVSEVTPAALALEECCHWIGPEEQRPSRRAAVEVLLKWALASRWGAVPGLRLAWIVLGQRRVQVASEDPRARMWYRAGRRFPDWPPDLLARVPDVERLLRVAGSEGVRSRWWNGVDAVAFVREWAWAGASGDLVLQLSSLPELLSAVERARSSAEARIHRFLGILGEAMVAARRPGLEGEAPGVAGSGADVDAEWVRLLTKEFRAKGKGPRGVRRVAAGRQAVVQRTFHSLVGVPLVFGGSDCVWEREEIPETMVKSEVFAVLRPVLRCAVRVPEPFWGGIWSGVAGRLAGWIGLDVAGRLGVWIDQCLGELVPGPRGDLPLRVALDLVQLWAGSSRREAANLDRCLEMLVGHGGKVFEWMKAYSGRQRRSHSLLQRCGLQWQISNPIAGLARLGPLSPEDAALLVRHDLVTNLDGMLRHGSARVIAFAAHVRLLASESGTSVSKCAQPWIFASASEALLSWYRAARARMVKDGGLPAHVVAEVLSEALDHLEETPAMEGLFLRWPQVFDAMVKSARKRPETRGELGSKNSEREWSDVGRRFEARLGLLQLLVAFEESDLGDVEAAARELLVWWEPKEAAMMRSTEGIPFTPRYITADRWRLFVLAEGCLARVCRLLEVSHDGVVRWDHAEVGWKFLQAHPGARALVRECLDDSGWVKRAVALLARLGVALQLRMTSDLERELRDWTLPEPVLPGLPDGLPPELRADLSALAAHRRRAGQPEMPPSEIRAMLDRPARLRSEREFLADLIAAGHPNPRVRQRLANLERYLANPGGLESEMAAELRKVLPGALLRARLASLETVPDRVMAEHWRRTFAIATPAPFHPDWDNALLLYCELDKNRALLRRLLTREAAGDRLWRLDHPANRKWMQSVRSLGVDVDGWLGEFVATRVTSTDSWTVSAEQDPLRILQMGNFFDTCLARSGGNNFSTVANAVEVNKRVLYVTNSGGAVIGRKLIALVPAKDRAVLVGFRSYGASTEGGPMDAGEYRGAWIKIVLDLLCARMAREAGAAFPVSDDEASELSVKGRLFACWYNDGPETFDWWVTDVRIWPADRPEPDRERLLVECALRLERPDREEKLASLRGLLWLGRDALPVVERVDAARFGESEYKYLVRCFRPLGLR